MDFDSRMLFWAGAKDHSVSRKKIYVWFLCFTEDALYDVFILVTIRNFTFDGEFQNYFVWILNLARQCRLCNNLKGVLGRTKPST